MEEKKVKKISLSTSFLILAIITICIMCFFLYNSTLKTNDMISNEKESNEKELNAKIAELENEPTAKNNQINTEQNNSNSNSNEVSNTNNTTSNNSNITTNMSFNSLSGLYKGDADIAPGTTPYGEKEVALYLYEDGSFRYYDSPGLNAGHVGYYTFNDNNLILHEILECANDVGRTITSNTFTLEINTDNSITDNNLNAILKKSPEKIEESSNIISTDLKNALDNNSLK